MRSFNFAIISLALGQSAWAACNSDNCLRGLLASSSSAAAFCSSKAPSSTPAFVKSACTSASRISSACSCLTTPTTTSKPTMPPTTTSSTCSAYSATGCPTKKDPCCAFYCAEAQVPFDLCYASDITGMFATCVPCNGASTSSTFKTTSSSKTTSTTKLTTSTKTSSTAKTTTTAKTTSSMKTTTKKTTTTVKTTTTTTSPAAPTGTTYTKVYDASPCCICCAFDGYDRVGDFGSAPDYTQAQAAAICEANCTARAGCQTVFVENLVDENGYTYYCTYKNGPYTADPDTSCFNEEGYCHAMQVFQRS